MKSQKQKRIEAQQRAAAHAKLSASEQLAIITARPGESKREVAKLTRVLKDAKLVEVTKNTTAPAIATKIEKPRKLGRMTPKEKLEVANFVRTGKREKVA